MKLDRHVVDIIYLVDQRALARKSTSDGRLISTPIKVALQRLYLGNKVRKSHLAITAVFAEQMKPTHAPWV